MLPNTIGVAVLSHVKIHSSGWTTSQGRGPHIGRSFVKQAPNNGLHLIHLTQDLPGSALTDSDVRHLDIDPIFRVQNILQGGPIERGQITAESRLKLLCPRGGGKHFRCALYI